MRGFLRLKQLNAWFLGKGAVKRVLLCAGSLSSALLLGKETVKRIVLCAGSLLSALLLGKETVM